ncbi:MAG TPA: hypothetical protein VFX81_01200 [Burkholderiaceae bacterium]|nr:hypothetical protein [Burkholderiaceae bacterium]
MGRLTWLLLGAAFALTGCPRADRSEAPTTLPTRQTTIDPVNARLDAAAQDAGQRRQDIDNAAK